jgi:hypothetical protein
MRARSSARAARARVGVQRGKRQPVPTRQLQVARVADGQSVPAGEAQQRGFVGRAVQRHAEARQVAQEAGGVGFTDAAAPLVDQQHIAHFEPPQARHLAASVRMRSSASPGGAASGTSRAMGRPWRVITTVSPRSTSSSSWGRWVLASDAAIFRINWPKLVALIGRKADASRAECQIPRARQARTPPTRTTHSNVSSITGACGLTARFRQDRRPCSLPSARGVL